MDMSPPVNGSQAIDKMLSPVGYERFTPLTNDVRPTIVVHKTPGAQAGLEISPNVRQIVGQTADNWLIAGIDGTARVAHGSWIKDLAIQVMWPERTLKAPKDG